MQQIKDRLEALTPKAKRNAVIVAVCFTVLTLLIIIIASDTGPVVVQKPGQKLEVSADILTGNNSRQLGIGAISSDLSELKKEVRKMAVESNARETKLKTLTEEKAKLERRLAEIEKEKSPIIPFRKGCRGMYVKNSFFLFLILSIDQGSKD